MKLLLSILLIGIVLISGCIGKQITSTASSSQLSVTIKDFKFNPATVIVKAGETIIWTNEDSVQHTATFTEKFDSGNLDAGKSFSHTFNEAGTFDYICSFHPYMKGKIIVKS